MRFIVLTLLALISVGVLICYLFDRYDKEFRDAAGITDFKKSSKHKQVCWARDKNGKFILWYYAGDVIYREQ